MEITNQKQAYQAAAELDKVRAKIKELQERASELTSALVDYVNGEGKKTVYNGRGGFIIAVSNATRHGLSAPSHDAFKLVESAAPETLKFIGGIDPKALGTFLKNHPDLPQDVAETLSGLYKPTTYPRLTLKRITKA